MGPIEFNLFRLPQSANFAMNDRGMSAGDELNYESTGLIVPTRWRSQQQQQQSQSGGKLLGQGVYGCTFEPAPRCAGGQVFSRIQGLPAVGKVTAENPTAEVAVGRAIMALPLAQQYFALPTETCKPRLPVDDADVGKCEFLEESVAAGESISMMVMPLAGRQLLQWSLDLPRLATNYRRLFIHLLEGMVIYQRAGYVHNDIHMGNVLVDNAGVARYIDFGLAFKVDDVLTWEDANLGTTFKPQYVWQAPEVHLWRMLRNGIRVRDGVAKLKAENVELSQMEHQFPARPSLEMALSDLANTSTSLRQKDGGGAFVRAYGKRFDAWRIGLCMWLLWQDLLAWSGFRQTELWSQRDLMRRVLGGLTQFNPRARWTAEQALAALDPRNRLAKA